MNILNNLNYFLFAELLNPTEIKFDKIRDIKVLLEEIKKERELKKKQIDSQKINEYEFAINISSLLYYVDTYKEKSSIYKELCKKLLIDDDRIEKGEKIAAAYCVEFRENEENNWKYVENSIVLCETIWAYHNFNNLTVDNYYSINSIKEDINLRICHINKEEIDLTSFVGKIDEIIKEYFRFDYAEFANKLYMTSKFTISKFPTSDKLNSFFVKDIFKVIEKFKGNTQNILLSEFLLNNSKNKIDIRKNEEIANNYLMPENMTKSSFPSKYPLRFSQALCVNKYFLSSGIHSVNGAPGTGKSTLLRDVIANIITERAINISKLDKPNDIIKNFKENVYQLNDSLIGYEIVVASSNNGAVDNISKEIPIYNSIDNSIECSYFCEFASAILKQRAWGMLCASLGNSRKRKEFFNSFSWDRKINDKEDSQFYRLIDNDTALSFVRHLINIHKSKTDYTKDWENAKNDFLNTLKDFENLQNKYIVKYSSKKEKSELEKHIKILQDLKIKITDLTKSIENININNLKVEINNIKNSIDDLRIQKDDVNNLIRIHLSSKPGLLSKLFFRSSLKIWQEEYESLYNKIKKYTDEIDKYKDDLKEKDSIASNYEYNINQIRRCKEEVLDLQSKIDELENYISQKNPFKYEDSDLKELSSPFMEENDGELFKTKRQLFIKALKLHEISILANAHKFYNNMFRFHEALNGKTIDKEDKKKAFESFFFIVPVVSTTFASFSKIFDFCDDEFLGHLLIDEAGQATPSAALGALMRSKKALIVGDPLQLEPVYTMPKALNKMLLDKANADEEFSLYNTSVQIRADLSQEIGSYLKQEENDVWIGSPLRVHNRCNNKIFKISNETTYDNLMIQGKKDSNFIQLKSAFIDAKEWEGCDKFINEKELKILKEQIEILISKYNDQICEKNKFISIITPFRSLAEKIKIFVNENFEEWSDYIIVGTIHTMQGKESLAVIFVLGGRDEGVRIWASSKPNLLNVAVTRAKELLIMIGIEENWKNLKYFDKAIKILKDS